MSIQIHSGTWMACFQMVVVLMTLLPLCSRGFGGKKVLPSPPKPPGQIKSSIDTRDNLYNCLITQVCDCGIHRRFETCWYKLPARIRTIVVDEINGCEFPEKIGYGTFKSQTDKGCSTDRNLTKACYDKVGPIFLEELVESSTGKRGIEEINQVEDARRCTEPTLAFCSVNLDQCVE